MLKILLPTDFSANAWNAIRYALKFLENRDCIFYILHAYTPAFYRMDYLIGGPTFSAIPDVGVDISMEGLEKTKEDIINNYPNPRHQYELVSAFNLLTDEIDNIATEKKVDMVIMGTQGASGAKEIFVGTNTVYIIRKARIPVMAIPASYRFQKISHILFPTDYWSKYKEEEFQRLLDLADFCAAEITVLHVKEEYDLTPKQEGNKAHLAGRLSGVPHRFEELKGALMPQAIMDYVTEHQFELLVMMNRKHGFLDRLMWRQNIDQIGFHVEIPFLVLRDSSKIDK